MTNDPTRPSTKKIDRDLRPRVRPRLLSGLHRPETLIDRLLLAQVLGSPRCRVLMRRRKRRLSVAR